MRLRGGYLISHVGRSKHDRIDTEMDRAGAGCGGAAVARMKLRTEMDKARATIGNVESYVGAICRRQFGCDVRDATEKQTWSLYFTLRNRSRRKRGAR